MTDQPLTDEELGAIERWMALAAGLPLKDVTINVDRVQRLVAEVRRLRAEVDRLEDKLEQAHYDILNAGEQ